MSIQLEYETVNVLERSLGSEQFYSIVYWCWKWSTLFPVSVLKVPWLMLKMGILTQPYLPLGKKCTKCCWFLVLLGFFWIVCFCFFSLGRGQATSEKFQENTFKTTRPIGLTPREDAENADWLSRLHACFRHRFQSAGLKMVVLQLFSSVCMLFFPSSLTACVSCIPPAVWDLCSRRMCWI